MILEELNRRLCADLLRQLSRPVGAHRFHMAIIGYNQVHMANLCVAMCFSVNGVSQLHGKILCRYPVPRFLRCWIKQKFSAITNGITHRRWLLEANPALTSLITEAIGDGFRTDAEQLTKLTALCRRRCLPGKIRSGQEESTSSACKSWSRTARASTSITDFIFDTQAKRLHEYKRQMLNALHIQVLYNRIMDDPNFTMPPRLFLFGAKAAPGYHAGQAHYPLHQCAGEADRHIIPGPER